MPPLDLATFRNLPAESDVLQSGQVSLLYHRCPRCDGAHRLLFTPLQRPIETVGTKQFTHWSLCPTTDEPVLISVLLGTVIAEDQEL